MKLNIAVIYGSVRTGRQGIKAARFVVRKLKERNHDVVLVDPLELQLPMLDKMYKEFDGDAPQAMEKIHQIFLDADAFVIVSAEYNHSIPAALKNLLDHFQAEYLYKPSALVTYSAGPFGGVRGVANLRAIMAELGAPTIPSAFPISAVYKSFDDEGNALDEVYEKRIVKFLDELEWYGDALKHKREGGCSKEGPLQQEMCQGK